MPDWQKWRKIKYEAELDPGFADKIASIPGGEKLFKCIQCGTCSGMCPLSPDMDYTPRQIIAMIRAGFKKEVLSSHTCWLCASCYACTVECPKEIKITDIMYAAKRLAIQEKVYPKRFAIPVLAREFFNGVKRQGRSNESFLLTRLYLKTNPLQLFKQAFLGLQLFYRGRMSLKLESIEHKNELKALLNSLEKEPLMKSKTGTPVATGEGAR
ncbi:MAG: 4Fe-4S dicluster domain-containing protein [candidate division Zixibacteria bacterium]|nr:4Fe-4S dicluster domain-containing protein [candidate division Zixibacteria bacterium]